MPNPPLPSLTIRSVKATPIEVPLNFVLGTSQGVLRRIPLLLIDLETEEGVTGRSHLFCYHALSSQRPGNGMVWDDDAVKHHRLR
jgi:mandelate racemase